VFDWLARLNITPEDIDHVVLTHVHADHHGLTTGKDAGAILRFPHAVVHVSRTGWEYNLSQRVNGRWNSYIDYQFADFLLEGEKTGRVRFHDNDEVLPGIDVIYLGGHAVCSQAVRVPTEAGPAIVTSDEVYHYRLLEQGVVARLHTRPDHLLAAMEKLVALAMEGAILVPCHDPALAEAYDQVGEDWLSRVRPLSDRAARGFQQAPKKLLT
jgi:glyoxylase-like metal-dependent hydrolase (beta-lactamase superfamily II)